MKIYYFSYKDRSRLRLAYSRRTIHGNWKRSVTVPPNIRSCESKPQCGGWGNFNLNFFNQSGDESTVEVSTIGVVDWTVALGASVVVSGTLKEQQTKGSLFTYPHWLSWRNCRFFGEIGLSVYILFICAHDFNLMQVPSSLFPSWHGLFTEKYFQKSNWMNTYVNKSTNLDFQWLVQALSLLLLV